MIYLRTIKVHLEDTNSYFPIEVTRDNLQKAKDKVDLLLSAGKLNAYAYVVFLDDDYVVYAPEANVNLSFEQVCEKLDSVLGKTTDEKGLSEYFTLESYKNGLLVQSLPATVSSFLYLKDTTNLLKYSHLDAKSADTVYAVSKLDGVKYRLISTRAFDKISKGFNDLIALLKGVDSVGDVKKVKYIELPDGKYAFCLANIANFHERDDVSFFYLPSRYDEKEISLYEESLQNIRWFNVANISKHNGAYLTHASKCIDSEMLSCASRTFYFDIVKHYVESGYDKNIIYRHSVFFQKVASL